MAPLGGSDANEGEDGRGEQRHHVEGRAGAVRGQLLRGAAVHESHVERGGAGRGRGEGGVRSEAAVGQR